jgi:hypothetical protein
MPAGATQRAQQSPIGMDCRLKTKKAPREAGPGLWRGLLDGLILGEKKGVDRR